MVLTSKNIFNGQRRLGSINMLLIMVALCWNYLPDLHICVYIMLLDWSSFFFYKFKLRYKSIITDLHFLLSKANNTSCLVNIMSDCLGEANDLMHKVFDSYTEDAGSNPLRGRNFKCVGSYTSHMSERACEWFWWHYSQLSRLSYEYLQQSRCVCVGGGGAGAAVGWTPSIICLGIGENCACAMTGRNTTLPRLAEDTMSEYLPPIRLLTCAFEYLNRMRSLNS